MTLVRGESSLNVITRVTLGDAHPEHPIVLPPDGGEGPEEPEPPIDEGAHPAHPIYYPDAHPEHPIVLPPTDGGEPEEPPETPGFEAKVGWTEETGWVVVFVPTGDHVVPSRK
jgi:hypothetical protein